MSYNVSIDGDSMFLNNALISLNNMNEEQDGLNEHNILYGSIIIICLSASVEAFTNKIINGFYNKSDFKDKSLRSKIQKIYKLHSKKIDWKIEPYSSFKSLVSIRNWLIHYESLTIGRLSPDGNEFCECMGKDIIHIFTKKSCDKLYKEIKKLIIDIGETVGYDISEYKFAKFEDFEFVYIG